MTLTFDHAHRTDLSAQQIIDRAKELKAEMTGRFGPDAITLQAAIDAVIDAEIEAAQ